MKYKLLFIGVVLCFFYTTLCATRPVGMAQEQETLDIQYSPELQNLITTWLTEYQALNPALTININELTGEVSAEDNHLSFISGESINASMLNSNWNVVVGHDAIVPIVNTQNPFLNEMAKQGITAEKLAVLLTSPEEKDWALLLDKVNSQPLHLYLYDDSSLKQSLANFLNVDKGLINSIQVSSSQELVKAIQSDESAIGFCRLADVRQVNSNEWIANISLVPVDKNGNRRIDNFENIYHSPDAFARGVWIGKYPSALCGNLYVMSAQKPTNESAIQFLTWIFSEGGQFLNTYGYSDLASIQKQEYIELLTQNESALTEADNQVASNNWAYVFFGLIISGLVVFYLIGKLSVSRSTTPSRYIHISTGLNENTIEVPKGLYFDKTHTWSFIEKNGLVRIGLDDFMQHITGDITRVMMKNIGDTVHKGEKLLTISCQGKQLTFYSPVTGVIQEQNSQLHSNSALINKSPYAEGWIYLIEPLNWLREIQSMLMADTYKEWLKSEFMRLKVFLSYAISSNTSAYQHIIMQDGGELHEHVLADLEPEVWEEFQAKFIDVT